MVEPLLALSVLAFAAAHLIPLHRIDARAAAAVSLSALALRAAVTVALAVLSLVAVPRTGLFEGLASSSWHDIVPLIAVDVDLRGDPLAHAVALLPSLQVVASIVVATAGAAYAALTLRKGIASRVLGSGPQGTVVVSDSDVVIAVPLVGRGQIVVSDAALAHLDEDELRAGLAHEVGHLSRGHRPLRIVAAFLAAVGRPLPGNRATARALNLSLERDADQYAVRATGDRLALASAICKAAAGPTPMSTVGLGASGSTAVRLDQLMAGVPPSGGAAERCALALAVILALLSVGLVVALGVWLVPDLGAIATAIACA